MAATIKNPKESTREKKLTLIDRVDGLDCDVLAAQILPKEDGFISVNDDRSIRIWLKRETGKYWPSVCHYAERVPTCLFYHPEPRRLFVGIDNGNILEFAVGEDYNKVTLIRQYLAHQGKVTSVYYSLEHDWVLSTGKDKYFAFHSTDNARRIGSYSASSPTTAIVYDTPSRHCFVGDESGNITFLKLTDSGCEFKANLNGHESTISSLSWDAEKKFLFSASHDKTIICWDIGGQKGTTYDLQGHRDRVQSIIYLPLSRQLMSASDDGFIVVWDMKAKRLESPQWKESDWCEFCKKPFFWNVKAMWESKIVGKRQHHCRRCGAAGCDECTREKVQLPILGHEFPVRVCNNCAASVKDDEKVSLATFHEAKHGVLCMSYDEQRRYLLTVGFDRSIKVWDISAVIA